MWYFAWILGLPLAAIFAVVNAMWLEMQRDREMVERGETARREPKGFDARVLDRAEQLSFADVSMQAWFSGDEVAVDPGDTLIAPLDQINVHSFLAPDNEFMGASVTQALCNAIGGKGKVIMTQGALGHTGAQGRAKGFNSVVKQFPNIEVLDTQPADWDVSKTARLWETYLTKYPQIDAAFFHNDDMALAAYNIMKARNRTNILIGGVDAMPPAIQAVSEGRMFATVRNPSCRIHGGAIVAGVAAVVGGEKSGQGIPKNVVTDGPVVTKANAAGMQWMEDHFLI